MERALYTALKVPMDVDTERSDLLLAVLAHCEKPEHQEAYIHYLNAHAKNYSRMFGLMQTLYPPIKKFVSQSYMLSFPYAR